MICKNCGEENFKPWVLGRLFPRKLCHKCGLLIDKAVMHITGKDTVEFEYAEAK